MYRLVSESTVEKNILKNHTVDYDPFIKSQLASLNQLEGVMSCKFGHMAPQILVPTKASYFAKWLGRSL